MPNLNISYKQFINGCIKATLMLAYMAVGYSIGFSQNYNEIQNNKDKITWLQQKTFDQQKEIDAFKAYVIKTENLEYQMNDLIKRITSLEALIKSRRQ